MEPIFPSVTVAVSLIVVALIAVAALFLLLGRRLAGAGPKPRELERRYAEEATLVAERTRALAAAEAALKASRAEADAQRSELARLNERLAQEQLHAEARIKLLQDAREAMTRDFKLLAEEIFQRHGETFARQSDERLGLALNPLRQRILEFQQNLQTAHTESEKERARLSEQIRTLSETSARMSRETRDLTQALRGKSQTQGAWGEMILRAILEKSGLREGEEYVAQQSHTGEDGERLRPDVIVRLPNRQSIVIDAKVSLTAYAALIAAETDDERAEHLRAHVLSMRQHVRALAGKEYQKHAAGALDYVVMFVPIEGALAAALTEAPELTGLAVESSVYIATPTTLMIALRTAANVWHVERRNRNAEEISRRAGAIYDKVVGFMESMDGLGKALVTAQRQYEKATGQLSRGNGNVLRQLEQLKALGAKTSKSLPGGLLDDADAEDAPAATQATPPGLPERAETIG